LIVAFLRGFLMIWRFGGVRLAVFASGAGWCRIEIGDAEIFG